VAAFGPAGIFGAQPSVFFRTTGDWQSGMVGEFTVSNPGREDIGAWTLEFDLEAPISNLWGGQLASHTGDHYVVKPMPWNDRIYPGSRTIIGFQAGSGGSVPTNIVAKGETASASVNITARDENISVDFKIANDWGAGLQADVALTNRSSQTIKNWSVEFELPREINTIWNARVVSHSGAKYRIDATGFDWNRDIMPGQTIRFGFMAQPGSLLHPPGGIRVSGQPLASEPAPPTAQNSPQPSGPGPAPSAPPEVAPLPPQPLSFDYAQALQKSFLFYEAQRSGHLPAENRIPWRGDSALTDGSDVGKDLTGGYYDAGDHVKFGLPLSSTLTMLSWGGLAFPNGYREASAGGDLLGAVRWGTDWLLKAHTAPNELYGQVGQGEADHAYWGPPEAMSMPRPAYKIDANRPGTELAGEAAAALASAAILFKAGDGPYSAELLQHARQLFTFADEHRGTYTDAIPDARNFYNSFTGYYDELAWAAAWLYRATGERAYLAKAESIYAEHLKGTLIAWTQSWDDKRYGTAVLLSEMTGKAVYKEDVESFLDYWTVGRNGRRVNYTAGGLAWLDQWGSLRYAANTAFLAFVYSDKFAEHRDRYRTFAERQINYILGDNPGRRSYVVGFGQNPPRNPHHRAAHGSMNNSISDPADNQHVLTGALVGGPSAPDDGAYQDQRTNFISNEVALDYNAAFTGALARMVELKGGR